MVLEILGGEEIEIDGNVQVDYKGGKTVIYNSDTTKSLIINPDEVIAITISKS